MAKKTTPKGKPASRKSSSRPAAKPASKPLPWMWIAVAAGALLLVIAALSFLSRPVAQAPVAQAPAEISIDQAYQKFEQGAFLLDVRTQEEWDEYHVPGTTLIPLDQLAGRVSELPKDKEIVVVCRSGNRSQQGRDILRQAGFESATSMAGGLSAWRTAGYPVEP